MTDTKTNNETAILAGGCFWCLEAVYDGLEGVSEVQSGYIGGNVDNPSYEAVCSGRTGHAEAVRIAFDPSVLTFDDLLDVFFVIHDPTTLNRQGADVGTQYRSEIFATSPEQRRAAEEKIAALTAEHAFEGSDCHRCLRRRYLLCRRALPRRLLRPEPQPALLPGRRRSQGRQVPQEVRRPPQATRRQLAVVLGVRAFSPRVAATSKSSRSQE